MDARDSSETIAEVEARGAKRLALMIAIFAMLLSLAELSGSNAEQDALKYNIDAANLWSFFQAKTIRKSQLERASELLALEVDGAAPDGRAARLAQLEEWQATIARYESEPEVQEGRRELAARAQAAEAQRDHALAVDNMFDYSSAALQLAIVLASASVVLSVGFLAWIAGGLGGVGLVFAGLGWWAPTLLPL
ncbi:MAG TPA: DUF4337 family protein [Afifellaceae bacterium]|nr:DUF4337 family protein [Afifellaceae bacterium]